MQLIERGQRYSAVQHQQVLLARTVFYNQARRFFEDYDLLLTPQMPVAAWSAEPGPFEGLDELSGQPAYTIFDRVPFMYPFNLTGYPAANLPCGFTAEGLPVGLQVAGRWHADSQLLRAAAAFEALQPWAEHRPPLD
jgi:aspartyl-tRNA(Asn)/glutamyl-tRNA(Gln) amidotransferase subunit A